MEHLKRLMRWFASGFALAAGFAAFAWVESHFTESPRAEAKLPDYALDSVQLSSGETIAFVETLTVAAMLESQSQSHVAVEVELVVKKDGRIVYTCPTQSFTYEKAGQAQRIQVECRGLKRASLPDGASTALRITRVAWLPR